MCSRYFYCTCRDECAKYIRILTCLLEGDKSAGSHVSITGQYGECADPPPGYMTQAIKLEADRLFELGSTPSQAQHKLKDTIPRERMPSLAKFQNRYRYFRYHKMLEHSNTTVMANLLVGAHFDMNVDDDKMFSFGYNVVDGYPCVGFGGASGPFKVGITTKALLRQMDRDPKSFVFHWDATYKINSMAYPVLVCGISDAARKFHPVCFFLLGKESENEYTWAMASLISIYAAVVGRSLRLSFVMADAAKAPALGVEAFYTELGVECVVMCFYHCVANSRTWDELRHHWHNIMVAWQQCPELVVREFVQYFYSQWINSKSWRWQAYHSPSGFPTTNNPCEAFNKHFKGVYTERHTHGLCATFALLGDVAEEFSTFKASGFNIVACPSDKLVYRTRRLGLECLLEIIPSKVVHTLPDGDGFVRGVVPRHALALAYAFEYKLNQATIQDAVASIGVTSMEPKEFALANAYFYNSNTNNVRHEASAGVHTESWHGWRMRVIPGELSCQCNYFKNGFCCLQVMLMEIKQPVLAVAEVDVGAAAVGEAVVEKAVVDAAVVCEARLKSDMH
ncbi:Aste57867_19980 [Aphanomyces stellatus]|uniref:Aste57867_19980 protein n=1 Tax=Aphanomyces stellatus TaxID=120398 RepID=A0A485LFF2_9STRA|nr:hypothetical protein As57867_019914 [Aphanomyces stellatus]VFT96677.1 Aste57867_19980 [Aphanomyces stellatus]